MNPCQFCGEPSAVHLTDIVNKKKREMHLCADCARRQNLIPDAPSPQLNLPAILQLMMAQFAPALERALASGKPAVIELRIDPQAITPNTTLDAIRNAASAKKG